MYDLWPPADYPDLTAPTPTVTGCTRNSTVDGLSTFTAQTPAVDAVTTRLIRPIFVKGQGGVLRWSVTVTPFTTNLLTANAASIETSSAAWSDWANCTIARTADQAADGSYSLEITATGGGTIVVGAFPLATVTPLATYTGVVKLRAATQVRSVQVYPITWDTGECSVQTDALSTSAWTEYRATATIPSGKTQAGMSINIYGASAGEKFYLDCAGIWPGTAGTWALPSDRIYDAAVDIDVQAQVIFLDDDDAQVGRWSGQEYAIEAGAVLSARLPVPRLATQAQLKVLSTHSVDGGQWTEYDSRLEQIPDDDPYTPPAVDETFADVSPNGVAPPAPPAGLSGFEANSPARRSPQVRWCQLHDSIRPDLTPKKNAREV